MGVTYLRTPCRPPCWFIILYICYTTKLFIILANMHVRHTRVYKNISNAMKELIELSIYNKVRWQMLDWFDHVMLNKFQIVWLLWCYITPIVSYLLFIILFFIKIEKEKEKTKVTYRARKGNRKKTHELECLSREKVSISRTGFFFPENVSISQRNTDASFFFPENWCRNRATLG
jgi:hypothetical protein